MGTRFDRETYVSLETFKKDGTGVKTPVWCAPLDGGLVVFTDGTSFKVKRIGRDARCRVAACNVKGDVRGEWESGTAAIVDDPEFVRRAYAALLAKYGWQMAIGNFFSRLSGRIGRRKIIAVRFAAP